MEVLGPWTFASESHTIPYGFIQLHLNIWQAHIHQDLRRIWQPQFMAATRKRVGYRFWLRYGKSTRSAVQGVPQFCGAPPAECFLEKNIYDKFEKIWVKITVLTMRMSYSQCSPPADSQMQPLDAWPSPRPRLQLGIRLRLRLRLRLSLRQD